MPCPQSWTLDVLGEPQEFTIPMLGKFSGRQNWVIILCQTPAGAMLPQQLNAPEKTAPETSKNSQKRHQIPWIVHR